MLIQDALGRWRRLWEGSQAGRRTGDDGGKERRGGEKSNNRGLSGADGFR